jgi:hypothetical protein
MVNFFDPPIDIIGLDAMQCAIEAWCKIHGCDVEGEYGRGVTAAAIDLYNAGYQSRERLTLALLARIPGPEAADKVVTTWTVH